MLFSCNDISTRLRPALLGSFAAHLVLLGVLLYARQAPIYAVPNLLKFGDSDHSSHLVYLAPTSTVSESEHNALSLRAPVPKKRPPERAKVVKATEPMHDEGEAAEKSARAGSPYGSELVGALSGHDVRPGYPIDFPDPPIGRDERARAEGDVIVEVTIDSSGMVVDTRLLQGVGQGIDQKIVATLQRWKFKPAIMDGRPIASKHDVHFHFPS